MVSRCRSRKNETRPPPRKPSTSSHPWSMSLKCAILRYSSVSLPKSRKKRVGMRTQRNRRSTSATAAAILMMVLLWGCGQKQPDANSPLQVPTRKGEVIQVKPPGDQWKTVGVVYPLESSAAEVASVVDRTVASGSEKLGRTCKSVLVYATDAKLVGRVIERLRKRGLSPNVVITPCEDDKAIYRAAKAAIEGKCDIAVVVKGELSEGDSEGGDGDDGNEHRPPPPVVPDRLIPQPLYLAPVPEPGIFLPRVVSSLEQRLQAGGVDLTEVTLVSVGTRREKSRSEFEWVARAVEGRRSEGLSSESLWKTFLVCLSLPDNVFWVNLNPNEPDRVIDSRLAETDIGRAMLEADLQLKFDTGEIIDPRKSESGKNYWTRLSQIAGQSESTRQKVSAETRTWIVPGPVLVECSGTNVYIVDAPLDVMLESERLQGGESDKLTSTMTAKAAEALAKEIIVPALRMRVNSAAQYAALRQAYHSLILARWWKSQVPAALVPFASEVNTGDVLFDAKRASAWDYLEVYNTYVQSFKNGVFFFAERTATSEIVYFYGGVDWTQTVFPAFPQSYTSKTRKIVADATANPAGFSEQMRHFFAGKIPLDQ